MYIPYASQMFLISHLITKSVMGCMYKTDKFKNALIALICVNCINLR